MAPPNRYYTEQEKGQLLKNLEIEMEDRIRRLRATAAEALENFLMHQEGQVSRIPKLIRDVTIGEFADRFGGDMSTALRGLQAEKLKAAAAEASERSPKKRKWMLDEVDGGGMPVESSRAIKNPRMAVATPRKKVPGTPMRARTAVVAKTPGTAHVVRRQATAPSPSPFKSSRPIVNHAPTIHRPTSPSKRPPPTPHRTVPPSAAKFDPAFPHGPPRRLPRKHESLMSVNGSPVANPLTLADVPEGEPRAPPPFRTSAHPPLFGHARNPSATGPGHSRANSQMSVGAMMQGHRVRPLSPSHSSHGSTQPSRPSSPTTPPPGPAALISIPLRSGHTLSFDALATGARRDGPASGARLDEVLGLDALGLTPNSKQAAREEVGELVGRLKQAVERWQI